MEYAFVVLLGTVGLCFVIWLPTKIVDLSYRHTKTSRNECRKLTSTALSNIGVSFIVVGIVTPLVYDFINKSNTYQNITIEPFLFILSGSIFHFTARSLLSTIEE